MFCCCIKKDSKRRRNLNKIRSQTETRQLAPPQDSDPESRNLGVQRSEGESSKRKLSSASQKSKNGSESKKKRVSKKLKPRKKSSKLSEEVGILEGSSSHSSRSMSVKANFSPKKKQLKVNSSQALKSHKSILAQASSKLGVRGSVNKGSKRSIVVRKDRRSVTIQAESSSNMIVQSQQLQMRDRGVLGSPVKGLDVNSQNLGGKVQRLRLPPIGIKITHQEGSSSRFQEHRVPSSFNVMSNAEKSHNPGLESLKIIKNPVFSKSGLKSEMCIKSQNISKEELFEDKNANLCKSEKKILEGNSEKKDFRSQFQMIHSRPRSSSIGLNKQKTRFLSAQVLKEDHKRKFYSGGFARRSRTRFTIAQVINKNSEDEEENVGQNHAGGDGQRSTNSRMHLRSPRSRLQAPDAENHSRHQAHLLSGNRGQQLVNDNETIQSTVNYVDFRRLDSIKTKKRSAKKRSRSSIENPISNPFSQRVDSHASERNSQVARGFKPQGISLKKLIENGFNFESIERSPTKKSAMQGGGGLRGRPSIGGRSSIVKQNTTGAKVGGSAISRNVHKKSSFGLKNSASLRKTVQSINQKAPARLRTRLSDAGVDNFTRQLSLKNRVSSDAEVTGRTNMGSISKIGAQNAGTSGTVHSGRFRRNFSKRASLLVTNSSRPFGQQQRPELRVVRNANTPNGMAYFQFMTNHKKLGSVNNLMPSFNFTEKITMESQKGVKNSPYSILTKQRGMSERSLDRLNLDGSISLSRVIESTGSGLQVQGNPNLPPPARQSKIQKKIRISVFGRNNMNLNPGRFQEGGESRKLFSRKSSSTISSDSSSLGDAKPNITLLEQHMTPYSKGPIKKALEDPGPRFQMPSSCSSSSSLSSESSIRTILSKNLDFQYDSKKKNMIKKAHPGVGDDADVAICFKGGGHSGPDFYRLLSEHDYKVLVLIDKGSFASVYKGLETKTDRKVVSRKLRFRDSLFFLEIHLFRFFEIFNFFEKEENSGDFCDIFSVLASFWKFL